MSFRNVFLIGAIIVGWSLFLSFFAVSAALAADTASVVELQVHNCNNNNICEPQFGETYGGCPLDCNASSTPAPSANINYGPAPLTAVTSSGISSAVLPQSIKVINLFDTSVLIEWQTTGESIGLLNWGKTADTEKGGVTEINYGINHQIELDYLEPATLYYFKIQSTDRKGQSSFVGPIPFLTLSPFQSPINILNFSYQLVGSSVKLTWQYSSEQPFRDLVLTRSDFNYPIDSAHGKEIYKGTGTSVTDGPLQINHDYYYAAFVENIDGNFSSGALLHLRIIPALNNRNEQVFVATSSTSILSPTSKNLFRISIEQNNEQKYFYNNLAQVEGNNSIKFIVSTESLPENFYQVILSVQDEKDFNKFNVYNLTREGSNNTFEALIPAYHKIGLYEFFISAVDANGTTLIQQKGKLQTIPPSEDSGFLNKLQFPGWSWLWILLIILLMLELIWR
ncbi:MAG TPA: fibronectin type III domain-containing protein [Candidatus Paceibacterota bacterium]|nr:fibronectin type III domain-containing protein [Candidatus Paceibacterota bacterium]